MTNEGNIIDQIKFDEKGLVAVIAQDYRDGAVLMLAYMNKTALQKTLETKELWYWSRSRKTLWHKGDTSGHVQKVKELYYDCDADALLARIEQVGDIACHTGNRSCFFNKAI
ncbi:phosphoribosyl-AMP cyclohydrolase [Candidatus Saganbacteria bacterium]|nr:phosphoribosyl-AMP cyclohydrolase [Candidatus Saganbacteria bacterium]